MNGIQDLPPDVYYFAQLTHTNHSGVVWVAALVSLIYSLMSSGVRFTLRRGMYGFDDAALLLSTLACVVQHSFVFVALSYGLGQTGYMLEPSKTVLSNVSEMSSLPFF